MLRVTKAIQNWWKLGLYSQMGVRLWFLVPFIRHVMMRYDSLIWHKLGCGTIKWNFIKFFGLISLRIDIENDFILN